MAGKGTGYYREVTRIQTSPLCSIVPQGTQLDVDPRKVGEKKSRKGHLYKKMLVTVGFFKRAKFKGKDKGG